MQWRRCVFAEHTESRRPADHAEFRRPHRDQTHKCDQQKLICIQKTDGCFHTEDCKCCKSEGVRQKQQVVVHNIGTAAIFSVTVWRLWIFQMINTTTAVMDEITVHFGF